MIKKTLLFLISLFVGIGLFIWIINFVGWQEVKNAFLVFTGREGIIIFALTLLILIMGNWKWQEILRGEDVEVSFWKIFKPFLAGFGVMFLAPTIIGLGEIVRAYGLKRKNNIAWPKAMASVVIDRIFEWTVNLIIIFFGVLIFLYEIGLPPKNIIIIFVGVFSFLIAGIFLFYFKIIKRESIVKTVGRVFNERLDKEPFDTEKELFNFFKIQNKPMWTSLGISFLRAGIMYLRTWFLILFLGKKISVLSSLSILGFSYFAAIIPIPTSLGSHEIVQTFVFKSLGLGVSPATVFTMIIRAVELLFALMGVIILLRMGVTFLKNLLLKTVDKLSSIKNNL